MAALTTSLTEIKQLNKPTDPPLVSSNMIVKQSATQKDLGLTLLSLQRFTATEILKWVILSLEAVVRRCSSKQEFLKILQCSQKNNCFGVSF